MTTYQAQVNQQVQVALRFGTTTGLTLAGLDTFKVQQAGSYVAVPATTLSASLSEVDNVNFPGAYQLVLTPSELGTIHIYAAEGADTAEVTIQVTDRDSSYVAGALADYVLTVDDGTDPISGATVRFYDGSTLVSSSVTDDDGEVVFTAPPGAYTYRVTAQGYPASGPTSITLTANESNVPQLEQLLPDTASIGDRIFLVGRYFDSSGDVSVFFDGVEQTAVPVSGDGRYAYVTVPAGLTNTVVQVYVRKDDPDNPGEYLSSQRLTMVRT